MGRRRWRAGAVAAGTGRGPAATAIARPCDAIGGRAAAKPAQAELARRLGTTRSAIGGWRGGGQVSPAVARLRRYAEAAGTRLTVRLEGFEG